MIPVKGSAAQELLNILQEDDNMASAFLTAATDHILLNVKDINSGHVYKDAVAKAIKRVSY